MTDTSGCCEGIEQVTPVTLTNRPGLSALVYRVGTQATFFETMLARLSSLSVPSAADQTTPVYPLQALTTRSTGDPALALLDAWAIVGDVFTFYQERIANEGYLRTATHRRSILELVRLVGYKPGPGVASSTYLAYTLQNGYDTLIPASSRAQSIPAAGQLPQSFETSLDLQARSAWSNMQPRMSIPEYITQNATDPNVIDVNTPDGSVYLASIATNLKPNDPVLFVFDDGDGQQVFAHVQGVTPYPAQKYTSVTFPVGFTPDVFNRHFAAIIQRYLNVDASGLPRSDANVAQVVYDLQQIAKTLSTSPLLITNKNDVCVNGVMFDSLSSNLSEWSEIYEDAAGIQDADDKAQSGQQPQETLAVRLQLANWIGSLINDIANSLNEIKKLRFVREGLLEASGFAARAIIDSEHLPIVTTGLGTLTSQLVQPTNQQPTSSATLARNVQSAFSRSGNIAPQLLTAFQPQLSTTLYAAYSSAQVTAQPPLQEFDALRVKAAPFGSSAPQQATTTQIHDLHGNSTFTTTYSEWPIAASTFIDIQVSPYDTSHPTREELQVTFKQGAISASSNVGQGRTIPYTQPVSFPASSPLITITVNVTTTTSNTLAAIAITSKTGLSLTMTPDSSGGWEVDIDENNAYPIDMEYDAQNNLNISMATLSPSYVLDLDARYDHIVPETWIVIEGAGSLKLEHPQKAIKIQNVETIARADYGISAKVTRLTLYEPWLTQTDLNRVPLNLSLFRGITVYAQSEALPLADVPLTDDIAGQSVELDSLYDGLQSGRYAVVSGERTDIPNVTGVTASELMMLASVTQGVHTTPDGSGPLPGDTIHTTLHFATPLAYTYKRGTVTVNVNVVAATQGETQNQILGSGSGSTAMQQFSLAKSPLTYIPAVTPTGEESTLQVFVNNVRWQEIDSLATALATDRVYITQTDNQDKVTITFGDGEHGARLPTGNENVKAIYRTGIGTAGNVDVGQITQLVSRPLGVNGVNNPIAATGGADREGRDQVRANVPLAATSLGRIVSVQDYADFARTFAGIGKASAAYLSDGQQQVVAMTIAGQDDIPIDPTSSLYQSLLQSLHTFGDPATPLMLALADVKLLVISARISIQADYLFDDVSAALRLALLAAFSFERRNLGQPVFESEVLSVMQQVAGVAYVDLDILDAVNQQQLTNALQQIQAAGLKAANTGQQDSNQPTLATLLGLKDRRVVPSALTRLDSTQAGSILPGQLVFLSQDVQDTLILNQLTSLAFKPPSSKRRHAHSHRRQ